MIEVIHWLLAIVTAVFDDKHYYYTEITLAEIDTFYGS